VILTADWHIRKNPPRARKDDFFKAMERKIRFILELARKSPPLLIAGDFFDQPKPGPFLEKWIIDLFREYIYPGDRITFQAWGEAKQLPIYVIPGQHDLPEHSIKQIDDSGLGVVAAAGVLTLLSDPGKFGLGATGSHGFNGVINGWPWGQEYELVYGNPNPKLDGGTILMVHRMISQGELWSGQSVEQPGYLLRLYPEVQLVLSGDNHQTFVYEQDGRYLVNPGSLLRQTAAQVDHRPCVFRYESDHLAPEQIFLPIEQDVLDLTQLQEEKARDGRIDAFVERLDTGVELGLDYVANLKSHLEANPVRDGVRDMTWRCVE
jgi:DNA repair exonuclease SbcCD nuclease subunit